MRTSNPDKGNDVERALEAYRKWSKQIAPYVQAAVAGKVQVPHQTLSAEVWLTFALYWEGPEKTLENLVRDADVVNHSLPSAEEIAWTLLRLKSRGWLSIQGDLYGLTTEGMDTVGSIVGKGSLRERFERLSAWISNHPAQSNR